jgi:RimJ/RimL family protein N-acetyltransferase
MRNDIRLREVREADLAIFFEQQVDPEANSMAAFTAKDPTDRVAFRAKWEKILADEAIILRTILHGKQVAGHIVCHGWFGEPEVSYWLGKEFWGQGIASVALAQFLDVVAIRPLYARTAKDNAASIRVLEKCGFKVRGEDRGFANARGEMVDEVILRLADKQSIFNGRLDPS